MSFFQWIFCWSDMKVYYYLMKLENIGSFFHSSFSLWILFPKQIWCKTNLQMVIKHNTYMKINTHKVNMYCIGSLHNIMNTCSLASCQQKSFLIVTEHYYKVKKNILANIRPTKHRRWNTCLEMNMHIRPTCQLLSYFAAHVFCTPVAIRTTAAVGF